MRPSGSWDELSSADRMSESTSSQKHISFQVESGQHVLSAVISSPFSSRVQSSKSSPCLPFLLLVMGGIPFAPSKVRNRPMGGTRKSHRCELAQVPPCWPHSQTPP